MTPNQIVQIDMPVYLFLESVSLFSWRHNHCKLLTNSNFHTALLDFPEEHLQQKPFNSQLNTDRREFALVIHLKIKNSIKKI